MRLTYVAIYLSTKEFQSNSFILCNDEIAMMKLENATQDQRSLQMPL